MSHDYIVILLGGQHVLTMTRYDDINEDVEGALRNSGFYRQNLGKNMMIRGRLYGRYVSGRCNAAPQQRV